VRKALNDNPVLQIVILGVLGVGVAFLLMTRVMHKSDSSSSATTTPTTSATAGTSTAPTDGSTAGAPGTATGAVPPTAAPSTTAPVAPSPGGDAAVAGALSSKLIPGPGLPKPVARAYADGKAIVLFVFRNRGIDDAAVRKSVERLQGRSDLAVFVTHAAGISRYARITEGVNVNQVPALVVVRPRQLSQGAPTATVSYGFRGPDSVQQAVRDGLYRGPSNLPYYPR
jgi:hypothetical protein